MYQHIYINESKANTISQVHHELPINPFKKHLCIINKATYDGACCAQFLSLVIGNLTCPS